MTTLATITLQGKRSSAGDLYLFGTDQQGERVEVQELIDLLFAWDHRSFFGTFIETVESQGEKFVWLRPLAAVRFLQEQHAVLHVAISWSEELWHVQQAARICSDALSEGWFVPCFERWKAGAFGWTIRLPERDDRDEHLVIANEWFQDVMADLLQQEPEAAEAFVNLRREYKALDVAAEQQSPVAMGEWIEEDDWLIAIGWKQDEAPFRTVIEIQEPREGQSQWQLQVLLQDRDRPSVVIETDATGHPRQGSLPDSWRPFVESRLGQARKKLENLVSWLHESERQESGQWVLSDEQAWKFLSEDSVALLQAGSTVWLPGWWDQLRSRRPRIKAKVKSKGGTSGSAWFGLQQLVEFDWRLALGDVELSEEEFTRLVAEQRRLVQIRGQWIQVDLEMIQHVIQYVSRIKKKQGLPLRDVLQMYWAAEDQVPSPVSQTDHDALPARSNESESPEWSLDIELNRHLQALVDQLQAVEKIPAIAKPAGLHAELRGYQEQGVAWLLFMRKYGLGCCLADDMGLGKTVQCITYLLGMREEGATGPALLICPTSVLGNWEKELQKFAPDLQVYVHYGSQRARGEEFAVRAAHADLVISSYSLAQLDLEELRGVQWEAICLDEAQMIKNVHTKQRTAILQLEGKHRIAMTGTPIENRLTELWSIFDFLNPGYLGSLSSFVQTYVNPIEQHGDPLRIEQIQKLVRPFLLRRVKNDPAIQLDLSNKYERKVFVTLSAEQGVLYEQVVQDLFQSLDTLTPMEKKGRILAALTKLKQICDHPALFLKEEETTNRTGRSLKMERLLDLVEAVRGQGESCLIFTQYVEMGHLLQRELEQRLGESVLYLHGGVPKRKRDQILERFQEPAVYATERSDILILSLKAGGTGLNLTRATQVFHFDRWWNPAVEDQATDRAYRIGQTRDVQVHKFVTIGTLEERIDEMMEHKQSLSRQIVSSNEPWITEMSTRELRELFALRTESIGK